MVGGYIRLIEVKCVELEFGLELRRSRLRQAHAD
jgi:hypothetical protein